MILMQMKNLQISRELFWNMYTLVRQLNDGEFSGELLNEIDRQINEKINAMDRHYTYTEYKTSQDASEREQARLKYLDKANIHIDWRY